MATDMLKKVPVREQDPKVRATNFDEVCLGYNKEEAVADNVGSTATLLRTIGRHPSNPFILHQSAISQNLTH